jgi:Ca2+-binding EF-hand superfamily protein
MDARVDLALDVHEMEPFFHYVFEKLFGVRYFLILKVLFIFFLLIIFLIAFHRQISLEHNQIESLFHLMDVNRDTMLGFDEFLSFIAVSKQLEHKCKSDHLFAFEAFGWREGKHQYAESSSELWKRAMHRVDEDALYAAWGILIDAVQGSSGSGIRDEVAELFAKFDSDGSQLLDNSEFIRGLDACGVTIGQRQMKTYRFLHKRPNRRRLQSRWRLPRLRFDLDFGCF